MPSPRARPGRPAKRAAQRAPKAASKTAGKAPRKGAPSVPAASMRKEARGGWQGDALRRVRALVLEAVPGAVEEVKWRKPSNPAGVPVWSKDGILCTFETYKEKVKLTFMQGARLADPSGLFNAGQAGGTRRAIDLREGDALDEAAFRALVREAADRNASA